jgi:hypothetical protein
MVTWDGLLKDLLALSSVCNSSHRHSDICRMSYGIFNHRDSPSRVVRKQL